MSTIIQKTTKSDQQIARSSAHMLAVSEGRASKSKEQSVSLKIQGSEEVITIPLKALQLLNTIISNMAQGKSITLLPIDSEITTQQAADILNVSRPHIVKLLEKGEIPYRKVGSHRRILLQDILDYEARQRADRRAKLNQLAKEAQKLKLGY